MSAPLAHKARRLIPARHDPTIPKRPTIGTKPRISRRQVALQTLVSLVILAALWEGFTVLGDVSPLVLPRFSAVIEQFPLMQQEGILVENLTISLGVYGIGMLISIFIGIPLGLAIGGIHKLDRAFSPYLWAVYTTPGVIIMPLILLWVGINDTARVSLVVVKALPAIAVVVMEGVKTVEGDLLETARSYCASRLNLFRHIVFPSTMPYIGTGLRMGVTRGLVGLFIGELFTSTDGIGYILSLSQSRFNSARTFAILLVFIAFSVILVGLSRLLERRLSAWRGTAPIRRRAPRERNEL